MQMRILLPAIHRSACRRLSWLLRRELTSVRSNWDFSQLHHFRKSELILSWIFGESIHLFELC